MTLLDNDHFLTELSKLFQKARVGGPQAVTITLKHCKPWILILGFIVL